MPSRIIREDILTSGRVDLLPSEVEVFYRRLLNKVDDHGLYDARPAILRASLYPLRLDRVSAADCLRMLATCVQAGLVVVYEDAGRPFLHVLNTRWKPRSEPKYPAPPCTVENSCLQLQTPVALDVVVDVVVDVEKQEHEVVAETATTSTHKTNGRRPSGMQTMLDAYHAALPKCQRINVLTPRRKHQIAHAEQLARETCTRNGWTYEPASFWPTYFEHCAADPWMRGEVANPNNGRWRQKLATLIDDERFATVMDRAIDDLRGASHE